MKYFFALTLAVIVTLGAGVVMNTAHAASEIGITQIDTLDQLPAQWVPIVDATGGVIWDQDCFYQKDGSCRARSIGGNLPGRVCTRGTGEGNYCGMVVEFPSDTVGGSCAPTNICSGSTVVDSCTGQVVQQCSSQCLAGACGTGTGGGGTPGVPPGSSTPTNPLPPGSCTAGPICSGTSLFYKNSDCTQTLMQQCVYGCAQNACVNPPAPNGPAATLMGEPPLVKKGGECTLSLSANKVSTCTLTGTGINVTIPADANGAIATTTTHTPALFNSSTYTLVCMSGQTKITKMVDCKVTPTFTEF